MIHESSEWLVKQAGHDVAYYNYESLFTETLIEHTTDDRSDEGVTEKSVVGIDFFSGDVLRLVYLISSLYMCFLPFNGFKRLMGRYPIIFTYLSNAIRMLLTAIISLFVVLGRFYLHQSKLLQLSSSSMHQRKGTTRELETKSFYVSLTTTGTTLLQRKLSTKT